MTPDVVRPEQVAASMVRRALDQATMPNPAEICDATGLSRPEVDTLIGKMIRVRQESPPHRRSKLPSDPTPNPVAPDTGEGSDGPPDDPARLTLWALRHPDPDIVGAALARAEQLRGDVTTILDAAAERARHQRIIELRAELAALEAVGKQLCECGDYVAPGGIGAHRLRSRKHRGESTPAAP